MASGMARSRRGFAGTVEVLSAKWPPCRLAAAWTGRRAISAGTSTRRVTRLWPLLAGCASGSTSEPAAAVPGRLEASVTTPVAGAVAATSVATASGTAWAAEGRGELVDVGRRTAGPARRRRGRGERREPTLNQMVAGSIPARPTTFE